MKLLSPAYRSHLIFTGFDGPAIDRGDRYAIQRRTYSSRSRSTTEVQRRARGSAHRYMRSRTV